MFYLLKSRYRKLFIHGTLTKLYENGEDPSYVDVETLQSKLVTNTSYLGSTLGDALTGNLFLGITDAEYTTVTAGVVKPNPPVKPISSVIPPKAIVATRSRTITGIYTINS